MTVELTDDEAKQLQTILANFPLQGPAHQVAKDLQVLQTLSAKLTPPQPTPEPPKEK